MSEGFASTRLEEEKKTKPFNFDSMDEMIDWYFTTAYDIIKDKYPNVFHQRIIMKVVRGIQKGLVRNIKEYQDRTTKSEIQDLEEK